MAKRARRPPPPHEEPRGAPDWVVTFTDMISLLVTFFVLLMTFSSLDKDELIRVRRLLMSTTGTLDNPKSTTVVYEPSVKDYVLDEQIDRGASTPHARVPTDLLATIEEMGQRETEEYSAVDMSAVPDGLRIAFSDRAAFDRGSAEPSDELRLALRETGEVLAIYPQLVVVEGHTDGGFASSARYASADELAFARARACADVLVLDAGVPRERIQLASLGPRRPRDDSEGARARLRNRRIELRVVSLSRDRANHLAAEREPPTEGGR